MGDAGGHLADRLEAALQRALDALAATGKVQSVGRARARRWGIEDLDRQYDLTDLAKGDCIFAATGVTDGSLLAGVKHLPGDKLTTESVVMRASSGTIRWVKGEHRR